MEWYLVVLVGLVIVFYHVRKQPQSYHEERGYVSIDLIETTQSTGNSFQAPF
jgi:hypothetical protein